MAGNDRIAAPRLLIKMMHIILALTITGVMAALFCVVWSHNLYRDYKFGYFMKQFGLNETFVHGDDVIAQLGEPVEIQYSYRDNNPENQIDYILLNYGSFDFGILGGSVEERIVKLGVHSPGVIKLRGNLDIGSNWSRAEQVYRHERHMYGEPGFILGKGHAVLDGGGIWISFDLDEEYHITGIVITDGL